MKKDPNEAKRQFMKLLKFHKRTYIKSGTCKGVNYTFSSPDLKVDQSRRNKHD